VKELLNENTLFATIAMLVQESMQLLLVVEGDDDSFALNRHRHDDLMIIPAVGGRQNILRAAQISLDRGFRDIRFLVDRDYSDPTVLDLPKNVFVTEHHDLFMDLIVSAPNVLDTVIEAHVRGRRRSPDVPKLPSAGEIRDRAYALAGCVAAVRIVNEFDSLGLKLERFPIGALPTASGEVEPVVDLAIRRSSFSGVRDDLVQEVSRTYQAVLPAVNTQVGDHDLFSAIARVLRAEGVTIGADVLVASFLAAVSCVSLQATTWFAQIRAWCSGHGREAFTCPL
jgi:hypothetical protein